MLTESECTTVTKGTKRKALINSGHIKQVELTRTMSSKEVRNVILREFSSFISKESRKSFRFLVCDSGNHTLTKNEDQLLDGDKLLVLVGQGSLYIELW